MRLLRLTRLTPILVVLPLVLAACSGSGEPTATYNGDDCDYDGPSEFELDSTVTFTVINESDTTDVGFSIWKFSDGNASIFRCRRARGQNASPRCCRRRKF